MSKKYDYDAIIIGAGISGLVCGCYLAKAGLKTLIVEKNHQPGGYCVSFGRGDYRFDACVHSLSSLRKGGALNKIFGDLELWDMLKVFRQDPSDIIITPQSIIELSNRYNDTIKNFQKCFPKEKANISKFFNYIVNRPINQLFRLRNLTFEQMVNNYFKDEHLKNILITIVWGLVGEFGDNLSALVASLVYREFIFDGGYYPVGGIQAFPDVLLKKFLEFGGEAIFRKRVKSITLKKCKASGVILSNDREVSSGLVVSACDIRQTFLNLLDTKQNVDEIKSKLKSFKPSLSAFLVYIGLRKNIDNLDCYKSNVWIIKSKKINSAIKKFNEFKNDFFVIMSPYAKNNSPDGLKPSLCLTTITQYESRSLWQTDFKDKFGNNMIKMSKKIIPGLTDNISVKFFATPLTLTKWTSNYRGAAYGWASNTSQFGNPDISQKTHIENLYLTGHWTNLGSGITSVVNCGLDTAKFILSRKNLLK